MFLSSRFCLAQSFVSANSYARTGLFRFTNPTFFSTTSTVRIAAMAKEYKLKGLTSLDIKDGKMQEVEVEGVEDGKVLLSNSQGKVYATGTKCTHYGAPLKNGVLSSDGRVTCPWHGACFKVSNGDVEDAPALDPIASYEIIEKDGGVYIKGDESLIKGGRRTLDIACSAQGQENVVVVGGGSGATGVIEELRKCAFKGPITVISKESSPFDRTKLSKALIGDMSKVAWRTPEFYSKASIDIQNDEVTSIDFSSKSVSTRSGKAYPYTKLVLASGGKPKSLPLSGLKEGELKNVFLLRSIDHVQAINAALGKDGGKKIVVIGSSFIGMEVANNLAGQKHNVSVIGMESEPCEAVFGAKLGKVFRALLEKNGVKFYMSAQVSGGKPSSSDSSAIGSVQLKDGTDLPAEIVIEGVGVGPDTAYLKDSKGGPALEKDGSVKVDENFAVPSLPGVFAIGDIATYPYDGHSVRIEHWNVAQNAGRQVARYITGKGVKPFTPVFWSALGMQLRYCGHPVNGYDDVIVDGSLEVGQDKSPSFAAYYVKGDDIVAVATMGKDPVMVQVGELMRRGRMPSKKDVQGGLDVLTAEI